MSKKIRISLIILFSFIYGYSFSQYDFKAAAPLDPSLKYGTLKNGMKYYIKANSKPEKRASFFIVHNVGSVLETPEQNGLAHFVEHMAFNGLGHYPGKSMLNYFESKGIVFGKDINAFTSYDVTSYNISRVPVETGMVDSALLVLHDWSNYILMEEKELDNERGVIREEWRTRRNADFRMGKITDVATYNNTKYVEHDVIGSLDVINNFSYQTIRDFYHKWYRPDLQAVVVIGDFDAAEMEQKVIKLFSQIPNEGTKEPRFYVEIPDNDKPLIAVATDPEASGIGISVMYKHNTVKKEDKNLGYLRTNYSRSLYSQMLNSRFSEISQSKDAPFNGAYSYYRDFTATKASNNLYAYLGNDGAAKALETLLIENKKVVQYGFTAGELERAKAELIKNTKNAYEERDKTESDNLFWGYFSHFLDGEPAVSKDFEYEFVQKVVPQITLSEINEFAKTLSAEKNMVVTITGPQKEGVKLPTEKEILAIIKKVSKAKVKPFVDSASEKELFNKKTVATKIISEKTENGITEIKYQNGVTVVFKPTEFKKNEISMSAFGFAGSSIIEESKIFSASVAANVINNAGISEFSSTDLQKKLAGKSVGVYPGIDSYSQSMSGYCVPEDFEIMLQLTHLYFTSPRESKDDFDVLMKQYHAAFENNSTDPGSVFNDSLSVNLLGNHPRRQPFNLNALSKVDYNQVYEIYRKLFSNANGWTFVFVGNIDIEKYKNLFGIYLSSLPSDAAPLNYVDNNIRFNTKGIKKSIEIPAKENKSSVFISFSNSVPYNLENIIYSKAINYILDLRYTATIREDEGGTYGVGVSMYNLSLPTQEMMLYMMFDCDPEKAEKLASIIFREIELLKQNGPTEEDLNKTLMYLKKDREEQVKENSFWLNVIEQKYMYKFDNISDQKYYEAVNKLNAQTIKQAVNNIVDTNKYLQLIMVPKLN